MVKGRKPVLSNRQLTRQVRSIKGTQGQRDKAGAVTASGVTLTAGTARIDNYGSIADSLVHYVDFRIKLLCSTAGGATCRLIFFADEQYDGTGVVIADILNAPTDSVSPYLDDKCLPIKEARHKNRKFDARVVVYDDRTISLNNGEPKFFKVRMKLNGRRFREKDGTVLPRLGVMALADESNCTYSLSYDRYYTTDT